MSKATCPGGQASVCKGPSLQLRPGPQGNWQQQLGAWSPLVLPWRTLAAPRCPLWVPYPHVHLKHVVFGDKPLSRLGLYSTLGHKVMKTSCVEITCVTTTAVQTCQGPFCNVGAICRPCGPIRAPSAPCPWPRAPRSPRAASSLCHSGTLSWSPRHGRGAWHHPAAPRESRQAPRARPVSCVQSSGPPRELT